jgi:hypothetical protein
MVWLLECVKSLLVAWSNGVDDGEDVVRRWKQRNRRKDGRGATDRVVNWHIHLIDLFACEFFCSLALLTVFVSIKAILLNSRTPWCVAPFHESHRS